MKRFSRTSHQKNKNSLNQGNYGGNFNHLKWKIQDQISTENIIHEPNAKVLLMMRLIKIKIYQVMGDAWGKIGKRAQKIGEKVTKLQVIICVNNKINQNQKTSAFTKLKHHLQNSRLKNKSMMMIQTVLSHLIDKIKKQTLIILEINDNNTMKQQNKELHKFLLKYSENILDEEGIPQVSKFLQIGGIQEPTINELRVKKNILSSSSVFLLLLQTLLSNEKYSISKLINTQNSISAVPSQNPSLQNKFQQISKQADTKTKEQKCNGDLFRQLDVVGERNCSTESWNKLERVDDGEIGRANGNGRYYDGCGQYMEKSHVLAIVAAVKGMLQNLQNGGWKPNNNKIQKLNGLTIDPYAIEEQTSLQESDVVEEVQRIIDLFIGQSNMEVNICNEKISLDKKKFTNIKKTIQNTDLQKIFQNLQTIFQYLHHIQQSHTSLKTQNSCLQTQLTQTTSTLTQQLQQKILQQQKLTDKLLQVEKDLQCERQKNEQLMRKQRREKQLEMKLGQLNIECMMKDNKIKEIKEEVRKFGKIVRKEGEKTREKQKKMADVIQKRLSQCKLNNSLSMNNIKPNNSLIDINKRTQMNLTLQNINFFSETTPTKDKFIILSKNTNNIKNHQRQTSPKPTPITESQSKKQQQLHQTINQLKTKLAEAQNKIKLPHNNNSNTNIQIKQLTKSRNKKQPIRPENFIAMIYNIMVTIKLLPKNSVIANQLWNELNQIYENYEGVQMFMNLQGYTVEWFNHQKQPFHQKSKKQLKNHYQINKINQSQETPKKISLAQNKTKELLKTIKSTHRMNQFSIY